MDESAGVVDGLRKTKLEDLGLQAPLHDLRGRQPQDVIELLLRLEQQAQADHAAEGVALKHPLLTLLIEREQGTCSCADLRQSIVDTPDLAFVLQAILADNFHLRVEALLLERALRLTEGLAIVLVALLPHGCCARGRFRTFCRRS